MILKERDKKQTLIGIIVTLAFHLLVLVLLMSIGLKYPDPPPPELGVEMDFGSLTDYGNAIAGDLGGSEAANPIHQIPEQDENIISQDIEESPITASESKPVSTVSDRPSPDTKPEEKVESINPNALFQRGRVKNTGTGEGEGSGGGKGDGDHGGGGSGTDLSGSGTSFSLSGRGSKTLGLPPSKTNDVGAVVVTIWVDQSGNVTRAVAGARGTTIDNKSLWRHCEYAASQSKFTPNSSAPFEQKGTITYKFQR